MARINILSPWEEYYKKINAFFEYDNDVRVVFDETSHVVKLYVAKDKKAAALSKILKPEKEFGNITVHVEVVPPNGVLKSTGLADIKAAFDNNGALSKIEEIDAFGFSAAYVIFKKVVVQFFNDDLGDYNGMKSTLYETIAEDIFDVGAGIFFCTDVADLLSCATIANRAVPF